MMRKIGVLSLLILLFLTTTATYSATGVDVSFASISKNIAQIRDASITIGRIMVTYKMAMLQAQQYPMSDSARLVLNLALGRGELIAESLLQRQGAK